jgi:hypothetical protein
MQRCILIMKQVAEHEEDGVEQRLEEALDDAKNCRIREL